ncbi:helicase HerA-like domain-containing protein [Bradyrhizobium sp. USDA 4350]
MTTELSTLPDNVLEADIAILGRKGGGKTYTSKGIVERLLDAGRRVLILDPLGVWAGLRTSADGLKPGYPVAIIGGEHADLPLDPAAAAPLAEVIAKENLPTVIDLSELSKSQQGLFLFRFLGELRRVNRDALTIVLEEADVFAPQNPMGDDSKALHSEIDWIARRGRFRGFRLVTITQRPARLSKDVLTQAATLIVHRLPAPQDRDAVKAWVDGNGDKDQAKEVFDTLARLSVGEAWVWSTEADILQRMKFPAIKTLDTSSTPKAGEARVSAKTLAQVDLSGIKTALAEAAVAEKPTKVGKQIGQAPAGLAVDIRLEIEAAEIRGFQHGYSKGFATSHAGAFGFVERLRDRVAGEFQVTLSSLSSTKGNAQPGADGPIGSPAEQTEALRRAREDVDRSFDVAKSVEDSFRDVGRLQDAVRARQPRVMVAHGAGLMPTVAAKIVDAIDMKPARLFSWTQVAMLAGYSESGGQFRRGKKWLIETGAVVEEGGRVRIAKPSGKTTAPTGAQVVGLWRTKLPGVGVAILDAIWTNRVSSGAPMAGWALSSIAQKLGYADSGGQFRRGVKSLRDARIADSAGGKLALTREFCELTGLAP